MRKVTVFSTSTNDKVEINTSAETLDQLRSEMNEKNISSSGMKIVVKETRATLEAKDALLPEGEFTLFLFPSKVKSGISNSEIEEQIVRMRTMLDDLLKKMGSNSDEKKRENDILKSEAAEIAKSLGMEGYVDNSDDEDIEDEY